MEKVEEFGYQWNPKTPRDSVKYYVDKLNVRTSFSDIRKIIMQAIEDSPQFKEFTPEIIAETLKYAEICHNKNIDLYNSIIKGQIYGRE